MLKEETQITKVCDPIGGSYMMESLTDSLVKEARVVIEEVEAMGGMTRAIEKGYAKLRIEEAATRKQARIDSGEDVVVGVNKYRRNKKQESSSEANKSDHKVEVLRIDNAAVRESQISKLKHLKANRDETRVQQCLEKLTANAQIIQTQKSVAKNPVQTSTTGVVAENFLQLAVDAARARATLGMCLSVCLCVLLLF